MEIWRSVIGLEGFYEVSNLGRIKSLARVIINNGNKHYRKERILKTHLNNTGYFAANINSGTALVHRLIAQAFIPNPKNLPVINHKNGIKTDNSLENLEWCTYQHNSLHAIKTGLYVGMKMDKNPRAKSIRVLDPTGKEVGVFGCMERAGVELSLNPKSIRDAALRNIPLFGYRFEYV